MLEAIAENVRKFWGYGSFRPLQREAMQCVAEGRDSLVVAPTGGGKSLCFQAPATAMPGVALVISPLLSLMKDQVDALGECGVYAARLDSTQQPFERAEALSRARQGTLSLLYLSPERLMSEGFLESLRSVPVSFIAIDEAHCISQWGHDFRPEYRLLGALRDALPGRAVHAYTATATPQVRQDIIDGLRLRDPEVLVGSFDRPNLFYRVRRREKGFDQITEILEQRRGQSGIIYCLRRRDVDELCGKLADAGWKAAPYHAGLDPETRQRNQDDFLRDRADIIVATVAFGMGIDKSNVRFVIHAAMPKSIEHYQQESGRAGRDGLPSDCTLLWSGADYNTWKQMLGDLEGDARKAALGLLGDMYEYASQPACRRKTLIGHFGQTYERDNCGGCDVCQGGMKSLPPEEARILGQKILSCVVRLGERFGGAYTASVLKGEATPKTLERGHDKLSTFGLLPAMPVQRIRGYIDQLIHQGFLERTGEYQTLSVAAAGWQALRGNAIPNFIEQDELPARRRRDRAPRRDGDADAPPRTNAEERLFETLRLLRKRIADEKEVPAFVVFSDATLRDMAARRPKSEAEFLEVNGIGERKCEQYAETFLETLRSFETSGAR